jgi:hypothetical protein
MKDLAVLAGTFGGLFVIFLWLSVLILAIGWPLMAFSVTRNVKKIRVEFVRLSEILDSRLSADARSRHTEL